MFRTCRNTRHVALPRNELPCLRPVRRIPHRHGRVCLPLRQLNRNGLVRVNKADVEFCPIAGECQRGNPADPLQMLHHVPESARRTSTPPVLSPTATTAPTGEKATAVRPNLAGSAPCLDGSTAQLLQSCPVLGVPAANYASGPTMTNCLLSGEKQHTCPTLVVTSNSRDMI